MTPEEYEKELAILERKLAALRKIDKRGKIFTKISDLSWPPFIVGVVFILIDPAVSVVLTGISTGMLLFSNFGLLWNIWSLKRL